MSRSHWSRVALCLLSLGLLAGTAFADPIHFESPHIHPLDIHGDILYSVNTPDNRVSVHEVVGGVPVLLGEVRVGIEPVSVRRANSGLLWVVNHLSDDVSIVDPVTMEVVDNVRVGDEPADVAFVPDPTDAGAQWALITISQEDRVVILEAQHPYAEVASIDIPGADPRAMAVAANGTSVWVAVFESGNLTTIIPDELVEDPTGPWGGSLPPFDPPLNPDLPDSLMPDNATIAERQADGTWLDEQGGDWSSLVTWDVMDVDLVRIDCATASPVIGQQITTVGTLIEDLAVDPVTGDLFVANIESFNEVLFEVKLEGLFARNDVDVIESGPLGTPVAIELNRAIQDNPVPKSAAAIGGIKPIDAVPKQDALAFPTELLFANIDGSTKRLFVTSIGGKRIAVINPNTQKVVSRLPVPEGGTGLVHHEGSGNLIMANRLDNSLHVVDPNAGATGTIVPIGKSGWDPTPSNVRAGRKFLYTGANSLNGGLSCNTCHPNANMDGIGWDLGDPAGEMSPAPVGGFQFHPLKGPMTTQTLRGLKDLEPFHWRGDREDFQAFNIAFEFLLGGTQLSDPDMDLFTEFIETVVFPPNPFQSLTGEFSTNLNGGDATLGEQIFTVMNNGFCNSCHTVSNGGTNSNLIFLGGLGNQAIKVAQLRNMYEKTGFHDLNGLNKRAFGYLHDGAANDLEFFIEFILRETMVPDGEEIDLEAYLMSFPTGTHAAVGAQWTLTPDNHGSPGAISVLRDLIGAATAGDVDLVAHGLVDGEQRGYYWTQQGWASDRISEMISTGALVAKTGGGGATVSYMAVPLGQGVRMGIDRDLDGIRDRDEIDNGTDPADPNSQPTSVDGFTDIGKSVVHRVTSVFPAPFTTRTTVEVYLSHSTQVAVDVYDLRGRRVTNLANSNFGAGRHAFVWNGRDQAGQSVASGTYLVQLKTPEATHGRKVLRVE